MTATDLIGLLAGTLTTVSLIPQLLKVRRSKSARDISYRMFILFSIGVVSWMYYGYLIDAAPVIITNSVTLVVSLSILWLKFHYGRASRSQSENGR